MIFAGLSLFSFHQNVINDVSTSWAANASDFHPQLTVSVIKKTWFIELFWDASLPHKNWEKQNQQHLKNHSYENYKITVDS